MKWDRFRKAVAVTSAALAIVVVVVVVRAALHQRGLLGFGDWLIVMLPVAVPVACAAISLLLYPTPISASPVRRGVLWGCFVGANGFLILLALTLFPRVALISQDGTAYWGLLYIPCFWVGVPSILAGGLAGCFAGLARSLTQRKRSLPKQGPQATSD